MLKLKSFIAVTLCAAAFTASAQTMQDQTNTTTTTAPTQTTMDVSAMTPPKPVQNKVFDAMVGTWVGESSMMGVTMRQVANIHWALNHQFLLLNMEARSQKPPMKYEGLGVFGVDSQNRAKTWWFDSWGADAMSIGSGDFSDNTLTITDSNAMFSETRTFQVNGNQMTMHAKGTMKWQGKDMPFDETTVFRKR